MSIHDFRCKDETQWTYYVVDHLPTMSNIYRFDTTDEAIACYKCLHPSLRSAIGSSLGGIHELDHIHRCANGLSVLVTAADSMETPLWRDSPEIQSAIDKMISELSVQHERNNTIFGPQSPSVIIELERYADRPLDSYFCQSILFPDVPNQYLSAIDEVFVMGHGWMEPKGFHRLLQDSRPGRNGEGQKDLFVERLSVRYLDTQSGYSGTAEISPQQYGLLLKRSQHLLCPEVLAADLDMLFSALGDQHPDYQPMSSEERLLSLREALAKGRVYDIQNTLSQIKDSSKLPAALRSNASSLQNRLLALTPRELRRLPLKAQIAKASHGHSRRELTAVPAPEKEAVR